MTGNDKMIVVKPEIWKNTTHKVRKSVRFREKRQPEC